jgi:glycosyltransferase involved in cell wall biosynthesis
MDQPTISIILTTFNRPHLLPRAIESVLNQTFRKFELIIIDDSGKSVGTSQTIQTYNDERIRLISNSINNGVSASRNTGIRSSKAGLITFLDDDDEFYPNFLEKVTDYFRDISPEIGFIWAGVKKVTDTLTGEILRFNRVFPVNFQTKEEAIIAATTMGNSFGLTLRREIFDIIGYYDETLTMCEDTEFFFRLVKKFEFRALPEILVKIHRHEGEQLTDIDKDRLRLNLHLKILIDNADFISPYRNLFYIHYWRIAEMCYSTNIKQLGRRILLKMWKNSLHRKEIVKDFICYELYGYCFVIFENLKNRNGFIYFLLTKLLK